mgnify:CR=1 FL=1|tara:strand:- start:5625 stop:5819 length:195 start_codon:yes stop_codon:yes gene_type:complete
MSFTDQEAGFEEMEFLVKQTGLSHYMYKNKHDKYFVVQCGRARQNYPVLAKLNYRNARSRAISH